MAKRTPPPANTDSEVESLTRAIENMVKEQRRNGHDPNEWLRALYASYTQRFLADNERIWTVGSIIIPVSLAGFAAFTAIQDPQWWHAAVLGLGSTSMLFIWLRIADTHRKFQDRSQNWMQAIERTLRLNRQLPESGEHVETPVGQNSQSKIIDSPLAQWFRATNLAKWRVILFWFVFAAWTFIFVLTSFGIIRGSDSVKYVTSTPIPNATISSPVMMPTTSFQTVSTATATAIPAPQITGTPSGTP